MYINYYTYILITLGLGIIIYEKIIIMHLQYHRVLLRVISCWIFMTKFLRVNNLLLHENML